MSTYNPTSILDEPESSRIEYLIGVAYKTPCITLIDRTYTHITQLITYDDTNQTYSVTCINEDNQTIQLEFTSQGVFDSIHATDTDLEVNYVFLENIDIHTDKFTSMVETLVETVSPEQSEIFSYYILHNILRAILTGGFVCFKPWWSHTHAQEQRSFASCMDWIIQRRELYPTMRLYHYASYEPSAFRRLAEQHPTDKYKLYLRQNPDLFYDIYDIIPKFADFSGRGHGLKQAERIVLQVLLDQLTTREAVN